jgi:hypothetical protein
MNFLLLGLDSLIACIAIGALVDRRSWVWLAGLFGLADGVAFLIGAGLGVGLLSAAASEVVEMGTLVLLGVYLLVVAAGTAQMTARWAIWLLPLALTMDNLTFGLAGEQTGTLGGEALAQTLSSGMLAYLGLFVAVLLPRVLGAKVEATRIAGASLLIGAGALFVVGG